MCKKGGSKLIGRPAGIVSVELATKSVWPGTHSKSCKGRVSYFRSCSAEAASAK